jgi:hypothetical protein
MPAAACRVELLRATRAGTADALGRELDNHRPYLLPIAAAQQDADLQGKAGASNLAQELLLEARPISINFTTVSPMSGRLG